MPLVKGLTVTVHTKNGPLMEYGTKRIGSGSLISSFIQSEDNTPFWINFYPSDSFEFQNPSGLDPAWRPAKFKSLGLKNQLTSWDLSAHIYIDENLKSDKNLIIDLPHHGKKFEPIMTARGRSCVDRNGVVGEQEWVFKEVGIENYFQKLTTDEKMEDGKDDWETISDNESKSDANNTTSMGQIKINLFRVRQRGADKTKKLGRPCQTAFENQPINSSVDISHTIRVGKLKPKTFNYITVDYLDSPNVPWATIIFMYRGKEQLEKMGFTPRKGPTKGSIDIDISQPGPHRSLRSTLGTVSFNNDAYRFDDSAILTKSPGCIKPLTTLSCILKDSKELDAKGGKCQGFLPSSSDISSQPKPVVCLKRKPSHQNEITAGLSAMSLNGLSRISDVDGYNSSGRRSLKKKRTVGNLISAAGLVCQKKTVKEEVEDGGEKLLT